MAAQTNTVAVLVTIALIVLAALGVWWYVNYNQTAGPAGFYAQPSPPQSGQLQGTIVAH